MFPGTYTPGPGDPSPGGGLNRPSVSLFAHTLESPAGVCGPLPRLPGRRPTSPSCTAVLVARLGDGVSSQQKPSAQGVEPHQLWLRSALLSGVPAFRLPYIDFPSKPLTESIPLSHSRLHLQVQQANPKTVSHFRV